MTAGRPPGRALDPDLQGPVSEAVISVGSRGRAQLPSHLASRLSWVSKEEEGFAALAVIEPGKVSLTDWQAFAPAVLTRRRELIERGDSEALEALRLLEARYKRLGVLPDFRVTLTPEMLVQLDALNNVDCPVFVQLVKDRLDLLSRGRHETLLRSDHSLLDGLP